MRALTAPLTLVVAAAIGAAIAIAPTSFAATEASETVLLHRVLLDGATEATIVVKLDAGRLWLGGGSLAAGTVVDQSELLRGEFTFHGDAAPDISYEVVEPGAEGRLVIAPAATDSLWSWSPHEQRWFLYVNPTIPAKLKIQLGTGDAELVVGGMLLSELDIEAGAGNLTLDLTGDWRTNLAGTIDIGAGDLTIRTPRETGVRIVPSQGVGSIHGEGFVANDGAYANAAYGTTMTSIEITVEQGAGHIELSDW